jgi:hypothetical protein
MNKRECGSLGAALAILWIAVSPSIAAQDSCDRACLKQITDRYFEALAKNSPAGLPLAATVKATENGRPVKLGEGLWKSAGATTYRMDTFDPHTGGAGIIAIVMEKDQPVILALRLKVEQGKIAEAETILCRKGDAGVLWAPDKLTQPPAHFARWIRPSERDSRYALIDAADGYFRAFETEGTSEYVRAAMLPDTNRFENGLQTTNVSLGGRKPTTATEQFDMAQFKNARIYDRRYPVIDEEHGLVMSIVRFGRKLNPDGTEIPLERSTQAQGSPLVAEFFAVTGGKIREIQAVLITMPAGSPTGW